MRDLSIIKGQILKLNKTGNLTPQELIEKARSEDSPLHKYFEWDDTIAGGRYRLLQAAKYLTLKISFVRSGSTELNIRLSKSKSNQYLSGNPGTGYNEDKEDLNEEAQALLEIKNWYMHYNHIPFVKQILKSDKMFELYDKKEIKFINEAKKACQYSGHSLNHNINKNKKYPVSQMVKYKDCWFCSDWCKEDFIKIQNQNDNK